MSLNKNKTLNQTRKNSGFTIVELLIVIVVIGILAAITIVAYNGVQNRARTSSAQAAANTIGKKAEAFQTVKAYYPTSTADFNSVEESKLAGAAELLNTAFATTAPSEPKKVNYSYCGPAAAPTGYKVTYFDYAAKGPSTTQVGGDSTATPCVLAS